MKVPALHREAERDTTGSFSRQPLVHTWNGRRVQGKRRWVATPRLIRPKCVKLRLTVWFYCGRRLLGGKDSLASRANHLVLLTSALVCAAAFLCPGTPPAGAAERPSSDPVAASNFPVATDARLAGDAKQTRFVLDLDKAIQFRAFALADPCPVVVIDPGHGGIDNGTQSSGESEKNLVLGFGVALRDRIEKSGKYRVVMTRTDDTFIPLADRVKIARNQSAALFVSIHADALPRREGDAQGATIYTLSDRASDAEAERLAEAENKADAIGGGNLTEEATEGGGIMDELGQSGTRTFSQRISRPPC